MFATINEPRLLIVTLRQKLKKKLFSVTKFLSEFCARPFVSVSLDIRIEHGGPMTVACALYSGGQNIIILSNNKAACFA
jgi:hypothetical protein